MGRVRVAVVVVLAAATWPGTGCAEFEGRSPGEMADRAGFTEREGLVLADAADAGRLDAAMNFTLLGPADDIAAALGSAAFRAAFAPGLEQVQPGLFDGVFDDLDGLESASDQWRHDETTINRHLVIGTRGDETVLIVYAFTT